MEEPRRYLTVCECGRNDYMTPSQKVCDECQAQLDAEPSFSSAEEQEGHFTLTEKGAELRHEREYREFNKEKQ